jgi:DNA-binding NarL/FixJ family response regulator
MTVVRHDARGLGLSDRDVEALDPEARARDLEAVAAKLGFERFALAGIQGGGNLAAYFAATRPERVTKLALVNWSPYFADEAWEGRRGSLGMLLYADWDLLVENVGPTSFGYNSPYAAGYGRLIKASITQQMAQRYGGQFLEESIEPLLPSIQAESLVVFSTQNQYAAQRGAQAAAAAIADCAFALFEGGIADHIVELVTAVRDFLQPAMPAVAPVSPATSIRLTARELEILALLAQGLSNRQMAELLVLSPRTVERHLENLYRKIGTHNRAETTAYAFTNGLAGAST